MRHAGKLAAALLVAGIASSANAASVAYPVLFPNGPVPGASSVNLPKFDDNGGLYVLTQVLLTLDAAGNAGSISSNLISGNPTCDLTIGAQVTATAPTAVSVVAIPVTGATGLAVPSVLNGAPSSDNDTVNDPNLAFYYAGFFGEQFSVGLSSSVYSASAFYDGLGFAVPTAGTVGGSVTVTYVYNVVPEPGILGLAGVSALGLLARRRRLA